MWHTKMAIISSSSTRLNRWNEKEQRYILGIRGKDTAWVRYPFPRNFAKAWSMTLQQSTLAYRTIKGLIARKIALSSLSSPLSIAYITGEVAKTGPYNLLMFMGIISVLRLSQLHPRSRGR